MFFCHSLFLDKVCNLTNASIVVTCSHLIVACWQQQPDCQGGLYVDGFGYQLTIGISVVESGVVTNTCISFNLSTTIRNVDEYTLSIWGQAPPGNGPKTILKPIAQTGILNNAYGEEYGVVITIYYVNRSNSQLQLL